MTQYAKVVDVSRTFVPVDPNAYPENLHGTGQEDNPEQRVPVVAYIGANFLPTAYGVKSFFGTNSKLDIDSLLPNKADHVFIFQTVTYINLLIALCDTGIWVKDASSNGAWGQVIALAPPADGVFAEWTYCTIKNKLYLYRSNADHFWEVETSVGSLFGAVINEKTPTFITANAQLGIYRLGARLGFWDGDNAVAYSSADDLTDFTPAVLTGANVTKFNSIVGKISAIRPHGNDVVVYASKSVVLLNVQPAQTFLVKAIPILTNAGVAYLHQSVEGAPDNTHYCYTDIGIFKITNGQEELIVPEIFDYFKPWANSPIYLKLLQGRYLCFEVMSDAIAGKAQFTKGIIPASSVTFPGGTNDTLDELQLEDPNNVSDDTMCDLLAKLDVGKFNEQQAAANAAVPAALRKPGTGVIPQYTCHLSLGNAPTLPITWTSAPCGVAKPNGGNFTPSPGDSNGKIAGFTTNATGKTTKTGADSWTDGKWTMERFVQYQTAVWAQQQKGIEEFLTELKSRSETDTKVTANSTTCAASSPALASCDLGRYPTGFSAPQFGFNKCSFWLTRYINGATDVVNKSHVVTTCVNPVDILQPDGYMVYILGNPFDGIIYPTEAAAVAGTTAPGQVWNLTQPGANINAAVGGNTAISSAVHTLVNPAGGFTRSTNAHYTAAPGKVTAQQSVGPWPQLPVIQASYPVGHSDETKVGTSFNEGTDVEGSLGVETAWCELTGYTYTDVNGATQTMAATACGTSDDKYPGGLNGAVRQVPVDAARPTLLDPADGSMCGLPFELPLFDGGTPTIWTDTTVTYPPSEFLLQIGSIAPKYPTKSGAFVYDLHLKKWGKLNMPYKLLFDYSPINSVSASTVDFGTFGILAGTLKEDGNLYLFDDKPAAGTSFITYGKIGYYRKGITDLQEVRIDFNANSYGSLIIDGSLDGSALGNELHEEFAFTSRRQVIGYPTFNAKWFNITVQGKFDISYLEFKGLQKGIR